jgi:hypothetical protein
MCFDSLRMFTRSSKSFTRIRANDSQRFCLLQVQADRLFQLKPVATDRDPQIDLLTETPVPILQRELVHRSYDARLVGWVEVL